MVLSSFWPRYRVEAIGGLLGKPKRVNWCIWQIAVSLSISETDDAHTLAGSTLSSSEWIVYAVATCALARNVATAEQ